MSGPVGVIYLLHFEAPLHHARHYVGFCSSYEGLESRLAYHEKGEGSRLLRAVGAVGIPWAVVRIWKGTRTDERGIKNHGHSGEYCPVCNVTPAKRRGLEELERLTVNFASKSERLSRTTSGNDPLNL